MSLHLAAVNGERTIPIDPGSDIAACARAFADLIDNGEVEADSAIVILDVHGFIEFLSFGPSPSISEALGMLDLAKAKIINGAFRG